MVLLLLWKRCVIAPYIANLGAYFASLHVGEVAKRCQFFVGTPLSICANTLHLTSRMSNAFCVQFGLGLGFLLLQGFLLAPVC